MSAPSFAEVLDDALARARAGAARAAAWAAADTRDGADPFLFTRPFGAGAAWTRAYPRPTGAVPHGAPSRQAPPPRQDAPPRRRAVPGPHALPGAAPGAAVRPGRVLTRDERRALGDLRALGAALTDAFTAEELRREYRRLALALHPDRHSGASPQECVRLGEAFARATVAYRRLLDLARPRH